MNKSELQEEVIRLQKSVLRRDAHIKDMHDYYDSKCNDFKQMKKWAKKLRKQNLKLRAALKAIA